MSQAADSIAKGDLVDNVIRGNQSWGLLPIQVCVDFNENLVVIKF